MKHNKIKRHSEVKYYLFNIILFLIIAAIITGFSIVFFCQTTHVKVKGNTICSDKEIKEYVLSDPNDVNAVYATVRNRIRPRTDIPFVSSYKVSMTGRNSILIKVKEEFPYGMVETEKKDKLIYYDRHGEVLDVSDRVVEGVLRIIGLKPKNPARGMVLPVGESNVKTILTIQDAIDRQKLKVHALIFSEDGTITFNTRNITVNLGTRASMTEKLRRLPFILPRLKKEHGTLHLEEWSEENTDIVFEREE